MHDLQPLVVRVSANKFSWSHVSIRLEIALRSFWGGDLHGNAGSTYSITEATLFLENKSARPGKGLCKSFQNHICSSFHEFMGKFMAQCSRLRCEDSILFIFVVVLGKFGAWEVLTPISFKFGRIKSLGYGLVQIQARVGCLCEWVRGCGSRVSAPPKGSLGRAAPSNRYNR